MAHGIEYLYKIDERMDAALYYKILKEDLLETLRYYKYKVNDIVFQHDNDLKHKAYLTITWLNKNSVVVLNWPTQSSDLNPIEHMWNELDKRLRHSNELIKNKEQL